MMARVELLRCLVATEQDVFAVRRQGRKLASALGLEGQDEIRVAAALSEVGRRLLAAVGPVTVVFAVERSERGQGRPMLFFHASAQGRVDEVFIEGVAVTKGLMDSWEIERTSGHTAVVMARQLPARVASIDEHEILEIGEEISKVTAGTPIEELAEHNRQLL